MKPEDVDEGKVRSWIEKTSRIMLSCEDHGQDVVEMIVESNEYDDYEPNAGCYTLFKCPACGKTVTCTLTSTLEVASPAGA